MPTDRLTASVKEKVERFAIYEADIKNEETAGGKRIFFVLGTRLVIERDESGQVFKRKGKIGELAWKTKQSLRMRGVAKAKKQKENENEEPKKVRVTIEKESGGTLRKTKTRELETILSASLPDRESSEYAPSDEEGVTFKKRKVRKKADSTEITSDDPTPTFGRKRQSESEREFEKRKEKHEARIKERAAAPERLAKSKKSTSVSEPSAFSKSSTSEIDAGDTGLGDCSIEEAPPLSPKKHVAVEWTDDQKKILYSSFARKSHDYAVYISPDEALKRAKELNVYDPKDPKRIFVSCPVFKVVAAPTQMMGKDGFAIKGIKKIYFQDRAGHVQAGMLEIIYHDNSNVEPNDFVFDATQIRDNIVPPVKISQDLKVPMIIGAVTTLLQILQVVTSYYLTTGITRDSSA